MKKKQLELLLYSIVGVGAMFVIVVAFNIVSSAAKIRLDRTQEKLYTLSDGTKEILGKLEGPIEFRYYCTQGEREMDAGIKSFAQRVEDLLGEFKQASKGRITIKKFNPLPDTDAEDAAGLDGIEKQPLRTGDYFHLGLCISQEPEKFAMPVLEPRQENLLEYEIARAISRVASPEKPVLAVMTPLPIFGSQLPPQMAMRMRQPPSEPWLFVSELRKGFDVRQIQMDVDKIDDDIKVLAVIHPKDISDKTQFAIDQFVLRGGKLLAFLDGLCLADKSNNQQNMPIQLPGGGSSMDKLLKAWGITFDSSKVVADLNLPTVLSRGGGSKPEGVPAFLSLKKEQLNKDDVLTSLLDSIMLPFAGAFTGTPAPGLTNTVLLKTTTESQLVEGMSAMFSTDQIKKDFKASGNMQTLAMRLTGKFKTAFPDGKPAEPPKEADKPDAEKKDAKKEDSLKESKKDGVVILVGDADFLDDQWCARIQNIPFLNQKIVDFPNGNLALAQSMVEQLAGDSSLIKVRSRAVLKRPFTVVQKMQAEAEKSFQGKVNEVQKELADTQAKLTELQAKKEKGQKYVLSPEQQAEVEKFRKKEAKAKKDLKQVKKDLQKGIDALEIKVKWVNILVMPIVVALAGLLIGIYKGQKARAR